MRAGIDSKVQSADAVKAREYRALHTLRELGRTSLSRAALGVRRIHLESNLGFKVFRSPAALILAQTLNRSYAKQNAGSLCGAASVA